MYFDGAFKANKKLISKINKIIYTYISCYKYKNFKYYAKEYLVLLLNYTKLLIAYINKTITNYSTRYLEN